MAKEKTEPWLRVNLGENGKHQFESNEELRQWLGADKEAWQWLPAVQQNQAIYQDMRPIRAHWETRWEQVDNLLKAQTVERAKLREALKNAYAPGQVVHHASAKGRFVATLRETGGNDVSAQLFLLDSSPVVWENRSSSDIGKYLTSMIVAFARAGLAWSPQGTRARFGQLQAQMQSLLEELATTKTRYEERAEQLATTIEKIGAEQGDLIDSFIKGNKEFSNLRRKNFKNTEMQVPTNSINFLMRVSRSTRGSRLSIEVI